MGVPIIQLPEDLLMMQELIYKTRPDVIIETGTAHGGTALFYASILSLIGNGGKVFSIDIEIRKYNELAIRAHPLSNQISLFQGDSTLESTVKWVRDQILPSYKVLVVLDSNHTKAHVLEELRMYSKLVTPGSYLVVFDSMMPRVADAPNGNPTWEKDSPAQAVEEFLDIHSESRFRVDTYYNRLDVTYCPRSFLERV